MNRITPIVALSTFLALILCPKQGVGQSWFEDFGHNNPALYTNLNGGPSNLTIANGIASLSGQEGTYYGRTGLRPKI